MHGISKEILKDHQIRNRKQQKNRFIEWVKPLLENEGYTVTIEESKELAYTRNIVLGNPVTAKYIFCAHYDTPAVLPAPNFLTPKNILIFSLYQLILTILMLVPAAGIWLAVLYFTQSILLSQLGMLIGIVLTMFLILSGKPNKHNANDNTSGIVTLIESAVTMPKSLREKVAYIFFDNEEKGMLGSNAYHAAHKRLMKHKTVINFDCVSDGDEIYVVPKGKAKKDEALLEALDSAFLSTDDKKVVVERGFFLYPSDHASFRKGVAVCAMRRSRAIGLYVSRIHTSKDIVFDERNIELLREAMQRLAAES